MVDRELTRRCLELITRLDEIDRCPPNVVSLINLKPRSYGSRLMKRGVSQDEPELAELRSAFRLKKKAETFLRDAKKIFGLQEHSVLFPPFSILFHLAWNGLIWELGTARGIEPSVVLNNHQLT